MSNIRYGDFKPSYDEEKLDITQPELYKRRGDIFDLADAFLSIESMTHKKLQKLCYYAKAWYLALYDENLVTEEFEAWVHCHPATYLRKNSAESQLYEIWKSALLF